MRSLNLKAKLLFLLAFSVSASAFPNKAEDITFDFLVETGQKTGYCDHIAHIQKILENYPVEILLELGVGYSTKHFLDTCKKVISIEFITESIRNDWLMLCLNLYHDYSNWLPIAYFSNYTGDYSWAPYKYLGSSKLSEGVLAYDTRHTLPDSSYLTELQTLINNVLKNNKANLILVDPPLLFRGPIIQSLFNKVPIIVSHDCAAFGQPQIFDTYGFRQIQAPANYETVFISQGKGTLIWIKKEEKTKLLIEKMKEYANLST